MSTHKFDWHAEPESSFFKWAVLTIVSNDSAKKEEGDRLFDQLSEATGKFGDIELGITINGIEVDAKAFCERLDKQMDWDVEREAKKLILQGVPALEKLQETVADLDQALKSAVISAATEAGFEISEDEWRDRW